MSITVGRWRDGVAGNPANVSYVDFEPGEAPRAIRRLPVPSPLAYIRNKKRSNDEKRLKNSQSVEAFDSLQSPPNVKFLPPVPRLPQRSDSESSFEAGMKSAESLPYSSQATPYYIAPTSWQSPPRREFEPFRVPEGSDEDLRNRPLVPLRRVEGVATVPISPEPTSHLDRSLDKHGANIVDTNNLLDRTLAQHLVAEDLVVHHQDKAQAVVRLGAMLNIGAEHLSKAQSIIETAEGTELWKTGEAAVATMLQPAKELLPILDMAAEYIPFILVAKSVFCAIVKVEVDRHENDKNVAVVYVTMTSFWFTLCDLKIVFDSSDTLKASIKTFLQDVCQTMNDFGNFRDIYYMHGHFARVIRSQTYKTRLTEFAAKFKAHQEKLRDLLTQQTALGVAQIGKNVVEVSKKFDMLLSFMNQRTPFEDRVRQKIEEIGGEDKAIRNTRFLTEIAEKDFNQTLTPQIKTALRTDLNELLQANFAMFELKVQAAQKSIEKSIERSTDTILLHMESGPHNLIDDEDIKTVWKNMKWRISCKARHFVDAVHQHFAHKYSKHRQTTGFAHPEQWTLKFLGRVIFQPTIGDAIDEDGSGYISVHEVNHFFKSRPKKWSSSQWLAFCAVGWYQNNLFYRDRCMDLLKSMETSARNVLPENRKAFKPYMKSGCIPEVWLIVDSLNIVKYRGDDLRQEYEALDPLRFQIMDMEMRQLFSRLQATKYQLDTPEGVSAVMGTTRTEAGVLCLLYLLLERHRKIIELAEKHVLLDREFETMIASVHNVAFTFGMRYHNLTEGWRQQRLDTLLQVQCFSGGIFESWHQHVMEASGAEADIPDPQLYTHSRHNTILDENRDVETPNDLLVFGLPPQPASDSGRRYRTTPKIRVGKEDGLAKERYGRVSQHLRASKSRRLTIDSKRLYAGSPRTPIRRLEEKPWSTGNPRKPSASPAASTHNFFEFDFEGENDGYSSAASSVIPAVHHTKTRTPRMEDRIRAVEKELSTMKDMLAQLLVLSAKAAKT